MVWSTYWELSVGREFKIHVMEDNSNKFYVVRMGDMVGIFKSLSDCPAQFSSVILSFNLCPLLPITVQFSQTWKQFIYLTTYCLMLQVCDPPASVYKGFSLSKDTESHLTSQGFKNATYVISARSMNSDLSGSLTPCPFQVRNSELF